ncbi:hypothetical protein B0H19DRAFT_1178451 [Mycena capillaripes]|nr:hypothetical protein B0H19DRAFT_1178451 [Mycena capillaripes]
MSNFVRFTFSPSPTPGQEDVQMGSPPKPKDDAAKGVAPPSTKRKAAPTPTSTTLTMPKKIRPALKKDVPVPAKPAAPLRISVPQKRTSKSTAKAPPKAHESDEDDDSDDNNNARPTKFITKQAAKTTMANVVDLVTLIQRASLTCNRISCETAKLRELNLSKERQVEVARLAVVEATRAAQTEKHAQAIALQEAKSHVLMLQLELEKLKKQNVRAENNTSPFGRPSLQNQFSPSGSNTFTGSVSRSAFSPRGTSAPFAYTDTTNSTSGPSLVRPFSTNSAPSQKARRIEFEALRAAGRDV